MTYLSVKQFIRSKLLSKSRPDYEIVAQSQNIDDIERQRVIEVFDGSQPPTTEIRNFAGSWVISSINDEEIGLLRQERSIEKELGRNYFLFEHFKVFNKKDLNRFRKAWLFVTLPYQQEVFSSYTTLEDQINIDDNFLLETYSSTLASLFTKSTNGIAESSLHNLHTLLKQNKLMVQGNNSYINEMIAALSIILPSSQSYRYKVFIGKDLPYSWRWNIAFIVNPDWENASNFSSDMFLSGKINSSYTKNIYKILNSNKDEWQDFPERLDKIRMGTILNQGDLEKVLGNAIFQDIGLRLISIDIKLKRANAEDVHLVWKELSDRADEKDVEVILQLLLEDGKAWDEQDYRALRISVEKHEKIVFDSLSKLYKNKPELFLAFIDVWLEKHPTQKELIFIENMLFGLHFSNISILLRALEKKDVLAIKLLALLFNNEELSYSEELLIVNLILRKTKSKSEITNIFPKLTKAIKSQFLYQIVSYLVSVTNDSDNVSLNKEYSQIDAILSAVPRKNRDILLSNLIEFAISLQLQSILISVFLEPQSMYEFTLSIASHKIKDLELWSTNAHSEIISASYLILLHEIGDYGKATSYLTQILLEDANKYKVVVDLLKKVNRNIHISLNELTNLKLSDQIKLFSQHIVIAKTLSLEERSYLRGLLKSTPYSNTTIKYLHAIYPVLFEMRDFESCQLVLEFQIKDALLNKNKSMFEENFLIIKSLPLPRKKILRIKIAIDYLKTLSRSSEKQSFIDKILVEPLSSLKDPKFLGRALATSLIFRSNSKEIFKDINCRLEIYSWIYTDFFHLNKD